MSKRELLTLRQIAGELGVNYNTLISCKKYFENILFVRRIGRRAKYPASYVDFFSLVFALKDEGYIMPEIYEIILQKQQDNLCDFFRNWVASWNFELMNERTNESMNELPNERMNELPNERMNERMNDLDSRVSKFEEKISVFENDIHSRVDSRLKEMQDAVQDCLDRLRAEINGSLTGMFKAVYGLQEAKDNLDERIGKIELDLLGESQKGMALKSLDLEQLQVQRIEMGTTEVDRVLMEEPMDLSIDVSAIKMSITEGKPDKETVCKWIQKKRDAEGASYSEIAEELNQNKIPTLRGKDSWNRGTVRNLIMRGV